ncbi:AP2 domain-containing protein [Rhizobium aethiopicum]|uniref:Putative GIY-YIG superfamily endonuclease n=1 Tax=Rhizobium aethiopicum TaxID=1138170 RepID=A0A7W6MHF9_9HYPH|nr:AP2 domain-containing protein [Rhizobium aethiopicum]MBB4192790.1 putative GIY-YIG superfamily endonuclease [Rhizobium aethiopicum]
MEIYDRRNAPRRADTWFVYGLVDSRALEEIRYIGITNNPYSRLSLHLSQAPKEGWKKSRWIGSVVDAGAEVMMCVLASGMTQEDSMMMEVALIAEYRAKGAPLMNLTDGGEGVKGQVQSAETRAKRSAALKGKSKSPEAVSRQAEAVRGRKATDEQRANLRRAHLKRYAENPGIRDRISISLKSRYEDSSERAKISDANIRRYSDPDERKRTGEITAKIKIAGPPPKNNSSGFKGVSLNKTNGKWMSYINVNGVRLHLGHHQTALQAAEAYDKAAIEHYGDACFLNLKRM